MTNDARRHLSPEDRQEMAVRLRWNGMSYRDIGLQLGVDPMTARADVIKDKAESGEASGVEFSTPENGNGSEKSSESGAGQLRNGSTGEPAPAGKVVGKDGKTYPAARPAVNAAPQEIIDAGCVPGEGARSIPFHSRSTPAAQNLRDGTKVFPTSPTCPARPQASRPGRPARGEGDGPAGKAGSVQGRVVA